MIHADRHGKLRLLTASGDLRSPDSLEDVLTSYVFGLLRYLPWRIGIGAFFELAGIESADDAKVDVEFWPRASGTEPDVYIESGSWSVLVEAKLYSDFGVAQLGREWLWLTERGGERRKRLIALTTDPSLSAETLRSAIRNDLAKLGREVRRPELHELCAITWRQIDETLHGARSRDPDGGSAHCSAVFEDLDWVFERAGQAFHPFEAWSRLDPGGVSSSISPSWYESWYFDGLAFTPADIAQWLGDPTFYVQGIG